MEEGEQRGVERSREQKVEKKSTRPPKQITRKGQRHDKAAEKQRGAEREKERERTPNPPRKQQQNAPKAGSGTTKG